ncbi:MAG TPA: CHAT domain-containing protein [Anaerolineae bacterium]|nr:CHAT domain-containing protein [Anaerolineae bacterium]HQH36953.1 CHAT domain-containing protein [Anaerolineae bacterium]
MTKFSPWTSFPVVTYETLVVRFIRQTYYADDSIFQLEVRQTPAPLPGGVFRADIEAQLASFQSLFTQQVTFNQFFSRFESPPTPSTNLGDMQELGRQLYALLPLAFQQSFQRVIQSVFEKGHGLRFILEARAGDKADHLLGLPWELLFFETTGTFLARSPRVLIVRRLLEALRRSPVQMQPPFNVIHVIAATEGASPKYEINETLQSLERDTIRQAIQPGVYRLVEKPGAVETMLAALSEDAYHIVHFLGHGEILEHESEPCRHIQRGYLRFVDMDNNTQWVTGEQLQHFLEFTPAVQLVVLNACHGGANVARSVALELVYNGLPYVVAIQGDILQESAKHFVTAFYTALQGGDDIAYAVAIGRAAIAAHIPQTLDWCLPVLYTNVGLNEVPAGVERAARLWQWMSTLRARKQIGAGHLLFGGLHLIVGLLLFISRPVLALPSASLLGGITAVFAALPLMTAFIFYWRMTPPPPKSWAFTGRLALFICVLDAASLSFGLSLWYVWSIWLLVIATGLWNILNSLAQGVLVSLILVAGLLLSSELSYSQMWGHTQAFISAAHIEPPSFKWSDLIIALGGYVLLSIPWFINAFYAAWATPPWGNMWIGIVLLTFGSMFWKENE